MIIGQFWPFLSPWIRIRIQKTPWIRIQSGSGSETLKKSQEFSNLKTYSPNGLTSVVNPELIHSGSGNDFFTLTLSTFVDYKKIGTGTVPYSQSKRINQLLLLSHVKEQSTELFWTIKASKENNYQFFSALTFFPDPEQIVPDLDPGKFKIGIYNTGF